MASSSSTSTLSQCERLPDELLLRVLGHVMLEYEGKWWRDDVLGVSRRWRALHDGACDTCALPCTTVLQTRQCTRLWAAAGARISDPV